MFIGCRRNDATWRGALLARTGAAHENISRVCTTGWGHNILFHVVQNVLSNLLANMVKGAHYWSSSEFHWWFAMFNFSFVFLNPKRTFKPNPNRYPKTI